MNIAEAGEEIRVFHSGPEIEVRADRASDQHRPVQNRCRVGEHIRAGFELLVVRGGFRLSQACATHRRCRIGWVVPIAVGEALAGWTSDRNGSCQPACRYTGAGILGTKRCTSAVSQYSLRTSLSSHSWK